MVDFNKLKELELPQSQDCGFVYFLLYKSEIVYIGQTIDLQQRISTHLKEKKFDKVLYELVAYEKMLDRERELISHYKPILNERWCRRDKKIVVKIIDDSIFVNAKGRCYTVNGSSLYSIDGLYGFVDGDIAVSTNYSCGELLSRFLCINMGTLNAEDVDYSVSDNNAISFNFCGKDFKYQPTLPSNYLFYFGKWKGFTKEYVIKKDCQYIAWFEKSIPLDDWNVSQSTRN